MIMIDEILDFMEELGCSRQEILDAERHFYGYDPTEEEEEEI